MKKLKLVKMKKYVFLFLLLGGLINSFQAKEVMYAPSVYVEHYYRTDSEYVPKSAKKYIKKNYPEAYDVKWGFKKKENLYKSDFKVKGERYRLAFTSKGKLIYFKGNISATELPSKIKRRIKRYYPDDQIIHVEKNVNFNSITYAVKIGNRSYRNFKNKTIWFDPKGNILN